MDEATYTGLLDAIYNAPTASERWPDALKRLGDVFACSYVGMIHRNLQTMEGRAIAIGVDPAGQREFFEVWSKRDVLRQWTPAYRAGSVETDQDILPRAKLLRSDYYNGFMKPHDMHATMRLTLLVGQKYRTIISFSRPGWLGDYESADVAQCQRLMPHLQRAARVAQKLEEANLTLSAFSQVLERSATGVLLLHRSGKVLFANDAARAIAALGEAITLRRDRIQAVNGAADESLQQLIAGASGRSGRIENARSGVLRLARGGKADLAVTVAPLAADTLLTENGPAMFVLMTDPDTIPRRAAPMLTQVFGLSAAETRVAERLILGDSPSEAASALDIKVSTARWHLAALYRKTGTNRQADLVRLLLSLPQV